MNVSLGQEVRKYRIQKENKKKETKETNVTNYKDLGFKIEIN